MKRPNSRSSDGLDGHRMDLVVPMRFEQALGVRPVRLVPPHLPLYGEYVGNVRSVCLEKHLG
jgi:hypothetical protein